MIEERTGLRAWLGRVGRGMVSDYRYPRALAAVLGWLTVLVALGVVFFGVDRVLDRLTQRALYGECVDDREAAFEVALADLLLAAQPEPDVDDEARLELRDDLVASVNGLRNIDRPLAEGGCPGQHETLVGP